MMFLPLENELFYCQHLFDSEINIQEIQKFSVEQKTGKGLEHYLKEAASDEEKEGAARTYLVKSKRTHEIAAYFTLRSGLFTVKISDEYFYTIPSAELSNFAVNSAYRNSHPEISKIGMTVFSDFIIPLVDFMRSFMGIQALYIYALPESQLINHYEKMGFLRLSPEQEKYVHQHVKPKYDDGCIFMYQILS